MRDTVYLAYGSDGIKGMTKTPPRKNRQYVKVTVEVPDPPEVVVTVPAVSPTVEATNFVEPDVVEGLVWCDVHGTVHESVEGGEYDPFEDETYCNDYEWTPIVRAPEGVPTS